MHWTINEEPATVLSFHDVIDGGGGALARTHVLHGLTLSRKQRMRLEDPTDVRLVVEISEFVGGGFRPKIQASIEIYDRGAARYLVPRVMAADVVRQTVGYYNPAVPDKGAKLTVHTVKGRLLRALLWRMQIGLIVCGEHDDCMANDELGETCARRGVTALLKAARNET